MIEIGVLKAQHQEIAEVAKQLVATLNTSALQRDASHSRSLLSTLFGKLNLHLSFEDRHFYPALLASGDEGVRARAEEFQGEIVALGQTLGEYKKRWPSAQAIQGDAMAFTEQTQKLIQALSARMTKEETRLYPLAER